MEKIHLSKGEKLVLRALYRGKDIYSLKVPEYVVNGSLKTLFAKGFIYEALPNADGRTYNTELMDVGRAYIREHPSLRNAPSATLKWAIGLFLSVLLAVFGEPLWNWLSKFFC